MSTFAIDLSSHSGAANGSGSGYLRNLATATHAFVAALLAVKPDQAVEGEGRETAAQRRARAKDVAMVNRMADQYQSLSPNLSAELRYLAARG